MLQPLAYLNGDLTSAAQASISIYDAGFVLGATVTEQLRTFRGELFRLPEHLARLKHSLAIASLEPREDVGGIAEIAGRLVQHNQGLLDSQDDLGLCIFVTPGPYGPMAPQLAGSPTLGIHTFPLPFHLWAEAYERGVSLVRTPIEQVPPACWPAELKCRSRMHYYLADRAAAAIEPGSRALLLDEAGNVSETSTANVVAVFGREGVVSPPRDQVLPGISLQVVIELAGRLGLQFGERPIRPEELSVAEEVWLTSTPNCLLPVTRFDGRAVGSGLPGDVYRQLLGEWNSMVGLDIAAQALRFSRR